MKIYLKGKKVKVIYISYWSLQEKKNISLRVGIKSDENMTKARNILKEIEKDNKEYYKTTEKKTILRSSISNIFKVFQDFHKSKSIITQKLYNYFFKYFLKYFGDIPIFELTKLNFEKWLLNLRSLNLSQNTIHDIATQGRHFLNFLFEYNYLTPFRINTDVFPRAERKGIKVLPMESIKEIFRAMTNKGLNFQIVIHLLYYTGLRPSDLYNIRMEDVNLEEMTMTYYSQKSNLTRIVPIHSGLKEILKKWNGDPLFSDYIRISKSFILFRNRIGIDFSVKHFRKTFISILANMGVNQEIIRELVGHSHPDIMNRHYTKFDVETLRKYLEMIPKIK